MEGEITIVKFVSGEHAIAFVQDSEDGSSIELRNAQVFMLSQEGIIPRDFVMFADPDVPVVVNKQHVLTTVKPDDDIRRMYDEKFGSGLVTPPEKKLIV